MNYLSEVEFDLLCLESDKVLHEKPNSRYRQANNLLHIIREHPVFLGQYSPIFNHSSAQFFFFLIKRFLFHFLKGIWQSFKFFYKRDFSLSNKAIKSNKLSSVFISHLLNDSFINHEKDFYFNSLPNQFSDLGENSLILYINYTALSSKKIDAFFQKRGDNKIVLPKFISPKEEIKTSIRLIKESFTLLASSFKYKGISKRIRSYAAIESLSTATHFSVRLSKQVENIVKRTKPDYLFTTYEGHPWERLVYAAAKKENSSIKNIGYQHAIIFKKQHALKRKLAANYNADFILTSGQDGMTKLSKHEIAPPQNIIVFGSSRTRLENEKNLMFNTELKSVLLLPEGDYNECNLMIELALNLAHHHKRINFVMRFHPLISIPQLIKKNKKLLNKTSNLILSDLALEDDFKRANFVIYRGTSTIIKAIEFGLYPVYYSLDKELSINPLENNELLIDSINSHLDFDKIINFNTASLSDKLEKIQILTANFFSPINYGKALKIKHL
ncbi:hypothetical protein N9O25_01185 [Flavobacteriaceae bacterium]|nr:hypothetical protein [Flavobacteriaceae bacterium]